MIDKEKVRKQHREAQIRRRAKDPEAYKAYHRAWAHKAYVANPLKHKERKYKTKIIKPPTSACEACGIPFELSPKGACLDHDHTTLEHRGWLCLQCNAALGFVKDSRERLLLLIHYLDRAELLR